MKSAHGLDYLALLRTAHSSIMSKDPRQNIRTEQMYRQLAGDVFKNVKAWVDTKPLRIPYVMIFLECQK